MDIFCLRWIELRDDEVPDDDEEDSGFERGDRAREEMGSLGFFLDSRRCRGGGGVLELSESFGPALTKDAIFFFHISTSGSTLGLWPFLQRRVVR